MDSPKPKYTWNLVPLSGRTSDVLQIVQVFYTEKHLFKHNYQPTILIFHQWEGIQTISSSHQLPGPHPATHWNMCKFLCWTGWLLVSALKSWSYDYSHSFSWAELSCTYTVNCQWYSKRSLGQNLQASKETFSLIRLNSSAISKRETMLTLKSEEH